MKNRRIPFLVLLLCSALLLFAVLPAAVVSSASASSAAPETLADFAVLFSSHADALEESFEIPCSPALQDLLFQSSSLPRGDSFIDVIESNAGMTGFSYYKRAQSLEFVNCRYYEGKRIVHAWRNGTAASFLSPREQETLSAALQLVSEIQGSDLDREKAVHDLLCNRVTYYTDPAKERQECDSAVGAILNGLADCDGYSDAFYLLGSLVGLDVRYMHGDSAPDPDQEFGGSERNLSLDGGHMWNLVCISGKWVMTDVTWDDQSSAIYYVYFNSGAAAESEKHLWEPQVQFIPLEPVAGNDLRPADLARSSVSSWDQLYETLRAQLPFQDRICLEYPASLNLKSMHEQLNLVIRSLGVEDYTWHFGAGVAEIASIVRYPVYRICDTYADASAFLDECADANISSFRLYFSPALAPALFANNRENLIYLLSASRLKQPSGYHYSEECSFVSIEDASYYTDFRICNTYADVSAFLDECADANIGSFCVFFPPYLAPALFANDHEDLLYLLSASRLSSTAYRYSEECARVSIEDASYIDPLRKISSADDLLSWLDAQLPSRPSEIAFLLPQNLSYGDVRDTVAFHAYSMGANSVNARLSGARVFLSLSFYPEFSLVSSRDEAAVYLSSCRSRNPSEIRLYCSPSLYAQLSAKNAEGMFSLMKQSGLRQKNLSHIDDYCEYIISPPEW